MKSIVAIVILTASIMGCAVTGTDASLTGRWRLQSIDGQSAIEPPTLVFDGAGNYSGSALCNSFAGSYRGVDDAWALEGPESTLLGCSLSEPVAAQHRAFLGILSDGASASVNGDQLTVSSRSGQRLELRHDR